ncbi:MAG: hypothetical protein P3A28_03675 [Gemmatimonadota bacterium]|nr:hypothetical protein [Gemmatimonadota bacterium]
MRTLAGFVRRWRALVLVRGRLTAAASLVGVIAAAAPLAAQMPKTRSPELSKALASLANPLLPALPAAEVFAEGARAVSAGDTVTGLVAVANGSAEIRGTVTGDVVTYRGDIVVPAGGEITGNAIAIDGKVRAEGGRVGGQTLQLAGGAAGPDAGSGSAGALIGKRLALVGGWVAVLIVISVGVLVLASDNLGAVADALERHYGNSLVAGVAGQVAALPLLAALLLALVLSVLGILLVPFAAVAYVIVVAGIVTLGFLGTAVVVGRGWRPGPPGGDRARRAAALRALVIGIAILLSPWAVAGALAPWPLAETIARGVAFAVTWVACTAGLGAAIISRAGITQARSSQAQRAMASPSWQTPTPVAGVVAARRPSATPTAGQR